ncbi:MAG: Gfo/Idh/MocA family protein [Anaerolineae bacterium]
MAKRIINFGIIGAGLMGREFASAAARWAHLLDLDFAPRIVAVCDVNPAAVAWFSDNFGSVKLTTSNYHELLASPEVEAVYVAVPHNLHAQVYCDVIEAGKHLMGEKPFGIDQAANAQIMAAARAHPEVFVRCSSEIPFFPGSYQIIKALREERFGKIIEVEAGFWHSSDLDPTKPINWKRIISVCGEYGCLGDLGMHPLHVPLRFGWMPRNLRALLSKVVPQRPDKQGNMVPCETWDNATLACEVQTATQEFPMLISTKRIAPGETNTWFINVYGTEFSAEFTTKRPKTLRSMPYRPGKPQAWEERDLGYESAYPTITGAIFEFGFSDAIMQMWAAYCDELVHGPDMRQPFGCVTPEETEQHHRVLTAALASHARGQVVHL